MKNNFKASMMVKLVAIVFSLVTVTFSWFVFSKEGWVNPFETNVSGAINVQISMDNENWTNNLVVNKNSNDYGKFTEFSGNGEKMYIPIISNRQITGYYKPDYSNREKDYIEINTLVKSDGAINFYLDPNSSITPSDPNRYEDNIAGAVRVAFLIKDKKPIIWAPNSTYKYVDEETVLTGNDSDAETEYRYIYKDNKDNDDTFIDTDSYEVIQVDSAHGAVKGGIEDSYKCFMWGDLNKVSNYTSSVYPIFSLAHVEEEEIVPMTIRVWVEGTDREAVAPLIGGKVKMNLKFMSESVK